MPSVDLDRPDSCQSEAGPLGAGHPRLDQVIYAVREMEPCVAFYRDVVGLPLKFRDGERWAAFRAGAATLALAGDAAAAGGGATAAFRAADLAQFAAALAQRSPAPVPAMVRGAHELTLTLTDPSGNAVVFYQTLPRPAG
ncbi:VOC family protein [Xanthobacter sp. KR7-225]|uniref:VOC family protein n=1 Tax=Xanthobacter sp. KR7-225 TaxID=3156613 RepID=UPI0032B51759